MSLNRIVQIFSLLALIMACTVVLGRLNTHAQPTEYEVKAAFLYNFMKFIEWPAESLANTTIIVGVLGEDPFGTAIDAIQSKTIREKKLIIKRIKSFQDVKDCHILFISSSEKKHLSQIFEALKGLSILTVGDTEEFAQRGVIINFYLKEKKVHFEINVEAARRAGLKISSKLLNLAKIVHEAPRGEDS